MSGFCTISLTSFWFHPSFEGMVHKTYILFSTVIDQERGSKECTMYCTMEHCEGHYQQVKKLVFLRIPQKYRKEQESILAQNTQAFVSWRWRMIVSSNTVTTQGSGGSVVKALVNWLEWSGVQAGTVGPQGGIMADPLLCHQLFKKLMYAKRSILL